MRIAAAKSLKHSHRPGLTLLEVLLGLAIFLMAIVAIGRLVDIGMDFALEASLRTDGTRLAQSKMAEVEAGAILVANGGSGAFDDEPAWSWSMASVQTSAPNLYSVTVTVTHTLRGQTLDIVLSQMVIDPLLMGTAAEIAKPETTDPTTSTVPSP